MAAGNGADRAGRRDRDTVPPGLDEEHEEHVTDGHLARLIRDAVHQEMRSTVRVELQGSRDMKEWALVILAAGMVAIVIGLCVAVAFMLWGPGA